MDNAAGIIQAAAIILQLIGVLVAHDALEAMLDVLGTQCRAVQEGDAIGQTNLPAAIGMLLSLFVKSRHDALFAAHIELCQRFADIFNDDATNICTRRHAG